MQRTPDYGNFPVKAGAITPVPRRFGVPMLGAVGIVPFPQTSMGKFLSIAHIGSGLLACTLLLNGCAWLPDHGRLLAPVSASAHKGNPQAQWVGRPYEALVAAYGPPRILLNIPGDRPLEVVAVYGVRDPAMPCVDAFTLWLGNRGTGVDTSTVTGYFCQ